MERSLGPRCPPPARPAWACGAHPGSQGSNWRSLRVGRRAASVPAGRGSGGAAVSEELQAGHVPLVGDGQSSGTQALLVQR